MKLKQSIHQFLPTFVYGDAISNYTFLIKKILDEAGCVSNIYAENIQKKMLPYAKEYKNYIPNKEDIIIHHFSTGSDINDYVRQLNAKKKIVIYHNITPAKFFIGYSDIAYNLCDRGRKQLIDSKNDFGLSISDSDYNSKELQDIGYKNVYTIPIFFDSYSYQELPNKTVLNKYKDDILNIIFVGRIAPNKKHEDIIKCYYYYKNINPKSRLIFVGNYEGMETYYNSLKNYIKKINLQDVIFTGHIKFSEILAYYNVADVFICMSEHEGFCVPLIEAMYFKIPIIAFNSSAIGETLRGSGVLFNKKDYRYIAEMINIIVQDKQIKDKIVAKQSKVIEYYNKSRIEKELKNILLS